jgi:hypothetical protein
MIDNSKEYILCAAIKRKTPKDGEPYWKGTNDLMDIEIGYRHHDIFQRFEGELSVHEQGFYTSKGRFVDRIEGMRIAYECGQVTAEIAFSKEWHLIKLNVIPDRELVDKEKYNRLFSEDLY